MSIDVDQILKEKVKQHCNANARRVSDAEVLENVITKLIAHARETEKHGSDVNSATVIALMDQLQAVLVDAGGDQL